jgi:hypothetical protein
MALSIFHTTSKPRVHTIGWCIYCFKNSGLPSKLTREHVVPAALGGGLILSDAVCETHRTLINEEFETKILEHWLGHFRVEHGLASERWKDRKIAATIVHNENNKEKRTFPAADIPATLILPRPAHVPAILTGRKEGRVEWENFAAVYNKEAFEKFSRPLTSGHVLLNNRIYLPEFIRFLAKIAHGVAVSHLGNAFEPWLLNIIEGKKLETANLFIGKPDTPLRGAARPRSHLIRSHVIKIDGIRILGVTVQLFAALRTPAYFLLVGAFEEGAHPSLEEIEAQTTPTSIR